MRTRANPLVGVAVLGFLPLAIPAGSPLFAEQRSKMQQPQRVAGLSEQREDKPAQARMPSAADYEAAQERTQGNSEGTADGERNIAPGSEQNTGRLRSDDDKDREARQN
jgi:hypothetical protein